MTERQCSMEVIYFVDQAIAVAEALQVSWDLRVWKGVDSKEVF